MIGTADRLRQKADEYQALGEEHSEPDDPQRIAYLVLEVTLRELADVIEEAA